MRKLQKVETSLAYLMPVVAFLPLVWTWATILSATTLPLILDSGLLPLYFLGIVVPTVGYALLGIVAAFVAKRDSTVLTAAYWILLIPVLVMSGFLIMSSMVWIGWSGIRLYASAPVLAILAALVSSVSRIVGSRTLDDHTSSDLV